MNKIFTYLGRTIAFSLMFLACTISNAATYYFSSTLGDDARSSAQAQNQNTPWRSIQKLNSIFSTLQPGDNILFKNGETFQGTLSISKSGTSGAPISFGSYGSGEKPVLTGFRVINNWVSKGGNIYEASIPEVSNAVSTIVIDNVLQAMGRYPNDNAGNSGYLTINSFSGGTIGSSGLQAPASMVGGEIVIRKNNWIIDRHLINWQSGTSVNYNPAGSSYSPSIGYGFFIQNHPATLDKHGEWYFNKATKKLLVFYQGNPASANIRVSTVDRVINTLNSASHIRFNNLTIQGSNENLVNLDRSSNFTIENCLLEYVGKNAINTGNSRNLIVSNSQIANALNGGINMGYDDRGTVVRNSTFTKIHAIAGMGQSADSQGNGIFMSETTSDVLVEYSTFLENGYNAIYFDGNNITVKNNLIDTYCFVKDDGAGIYTFTGPKNTTFINRKITNNIIVNGIGAVAGTKPYGANDFPYVEGIYLDLFANGIEIDGNTIGNVKSKGIFVNNCRNVSITNNKIFNTGYSVFITSDYTDNLTRNITLKNNEFLNKASNQLHMYVRSKVNTLGQMGAFDSNVYSRPVNESNAFNLQTPGKNGLIDLQAWKDTYGLDKISTKSPVAHDKNKMGIDEFILFDYNYSNSAKSLPLSGTYVDLKGKILSGSVSIPAYSSVLLLKTAAGTPIANVPPTVSITAPAANAQFFQGDNIAITSVAADSDGTIAKVDFYHGTTLLGTDATAPYSFDWTNLPIGSFALTAKATDNKGTSSISAVVNIIVGEKGNQVPTVSISSPSPNASFEPGTNISIAANAADSDGTIAKVDFYNGTTLLGTDTSSPYSFAWTNLPEGNFALTAKATDDKGTATVSASVAINVGVTSSRSPFGGTPATIPGTVEAEKYDVGGQGVTYFDVDPGNKGEVFRNDDVDVHGAVEGDYTVGWMNLNEWLEYTVNITTAGAYNLDARVAAPGAGGTFHIECNGIDVTGPLTVPATGGWDIWTSVKKTGVNLPAGKHVLRYVLDSYGINQYWGNLNSLTFTIANTAPSINITGPASNAQFIQGDNIAITANAADSAGSIAKVDFYNGTTLLGTDTTTPYSIAWTNLPTGSFILTAKATDNQGTATVSAPVAINVIEKTIVPPGPIPGTGLLEGLVAFYEMNTNVSGALRDSHGQNHGTSKLISHVTGFNDKGNKYNGKSAISSVPHSDGLILTTEFTLMADIYREGNGQQYGSNIIGKTLSTEWSANHAYSIGITPENKIRIRTNSPSRQDWVSTQTVPLGKWVRIIATYKSGEGYSLYFDTVLPEKSQPIYGTIYKSVSELTIGGASSQPGAAQSRWFEGVLDNVGIWNRKLSIEEITDLITNKITYPDFTGSEVYRVLMTTTVENTPGNTITPPTSTKAEAGQKLVFLVEKGDEKEGVVFDYWSIDGVKATNQTLFELEMPEKDITLTKHFRTFVAPEIKLSLPDQKSEFEASSKVNIGLQITSNDSEIMKVEIYNGESLMSELTPEATGFEWKDIPQGNHQLMARITDINGEIYYSDPVQLKAVDYQIKETQNVLLEYVIGPNPTTDYLNVIFKNLDGEYDFEFRIVSMNGSVQRAFIARPEESKVTIDVSDLVTGTYVLQLVANGKGISAKKFIKMQ